MKNIFYIFIGGGLGSVMRFLVSVFTKKVWNINSFPLGTFIVNITGCFIIGMLLAYSLKIDSVLRFLLITGFCGSYTTFSTFSAENYLLLQNGEYEILLLYMILSLLVGLLAVFLGFQTINR